MIHGIERFAKVNEETTYVLVEVEYNVRAVVVLPVGRKANWSHKSNGLRASRNQRLTTYFSASRQIIGVTDIGRNSLITFGCVTLGIGVTADVNHCAGSVPVEMINLVVYILDPPTQPSIV
jgi:hypothetical protein